MKLQTFGVIFVLIFIPLVLVLSYYIQVQISTLTLQNQYNSKLLDATYDAMSAFEINTANEDLSSVSDSLRTIIEASTNIYFNTLATNLGLSNASKSLIEPYVPAILYTLYDGYYIYTPTKVPEILIDDDGNALTLGSNDIETAGADLYYYPDEGSRRDQVLRYDEIVRKEGYGQVLFKDEGSNYYVTDYNNAELKTKDVLKTYIPYSARYRSRSGDPTAYDITVVYSLDNFINIEGSIDSPNHNEYYTKSGYLLPRNCVSVVYDPGGRRLDITAYNESTAQNLIESAALPTTVTFTGDHSDTTFSTTQGLNKSDLEKQMTAYTNQIMAAREIIVMIDEGKLLDLDQPTNKYKDTIRSINKVFNENCIPQFGVPNDPDYYVYNGPTMTIDGHVTYAAHDNSMAISDAEKIFDLPFTDTYTNVDQIKQEMYDIIANCQYQNSMRQYELDKISAAVYYAKGAIFSNWVYTTLEDELHIQERNLVEISGNTSYSSVNGSENVLHDFSTSTSPVFSCVAGTRETDSPTAITEIPKDSPFYTHKMNVIRNSIQYNLNLAMSTYNHNENYSYNYAMPVISNEEWNQILSKISIVSFMQGLPCGTKTFSDYAIVSSSNNELVTSPEDIFYIPKLKFNDEMTNYHSIECNELKEVDRVATLHDYIAFPYKEVKFDKIYDKNKAYYKNYYDHMNMACYKCVNDRNYHDTSIFDETYFGNSNYANLRRAFYIGVGKIRNNIYKMNAFSSSYGYEIILDRQNAGSIVNKFSARPYSQIKSIEIVFGKIPTTDRVESAITFTFGTGGHVFNNQEYRIATNNIYDQMVVVDIDPMVFTGSAVNTCSVSNIDINNLNVETTLDLEVKDPTTGDVVGTRPINDLIKYVRVIYK